MNAAQLPRWASDIISCPPESPVGFHNWLFRAARALWKCGRDKNEIRAVLENAAATCGRHVGDREISDAIRNSRATAFQAVSHFQALPRVNHERRNEIMAKGETLIDLWEESPQRLEDNESHTEELISSLFPGNPLLCCGKSPLSFATKTREEWHGQLARQSLIVPSPMTARTGKTLDGRTSAHSLANTGPRRYLVIEQDRGTIDEQAAILLHLAREQAPMVIAVHSGKRSIHGWFACHTRSEEQLRAWMWTTVSLGADPALWTRSQFTRMPDGMRENRKRQRVYFFNPAAIK
jgi:hypothetical protein